MNHNVQKYFVGASYGSFDSAFIFNERVMSEMHKQNICNDERCGNVDDVGEDEWVNDNLIEYGRNWSQGQKGQEG